ncbi:MAG TPA: dihydrodipicolinate synthase family protein [Pseudolabrys sp.]|uniref:dihydrodipicolinate synthase family protein n=1 Tax=Pseudolabrys sp. TaxID=1960880 RepID=UPI002DDD6DAA|nr:dihydrodipicolinate synthase family protein [Pseudolabrys sp.]HEV2631094.1 dihydrodipicolinate synthase family protein [Pseudolabrys sp.]
MTFKFGLVHAPLTPFANGRIDYATYGRLLDFHIAHGAEALALPMHAGESVSLTVVEREELLRFAIGHVAGRVPIIAHVSEAGTAIAASLAAHAKATGAAALIASVPYYWTPPQHMLVEHFTAIGTAGGLPFFVLNTPSEMADVEIASKSVVDLIGKLPNFAGLIDTSLDWQYMIEVVTVARAENPDFQFVSGTEYMISASAIGATGLLSPLASLAPRLVSNLYRACRAENYVAARPMQEDAAILFRLMRDSGVAGLKAGAAAQGRDCGDPRPPLVTLRDGSGLQASMAQARSLAAEPRGWA